MIGIIGSILSPIIGGVRDYVSTGQEMKKAEQENRARLLRDKQSNNAEWEMATLTDKDKWLRRGSHSACSRHHSSGRLSILLRSSSILMSRWRRCPNGIYKCLARWSAACGVLAH
jgi:hypothetical protein